MSEQGKGRRIAAWIMTGLITLMFVGSAVGKLIAARRSRRRSRSGASGAT